MSKNCNESPALNIQSDIYPASWYGKVPKRVKMAKTVKSELPFGPRYIAEAGKEYDCWTNSHGAVAVLLPNSEMFGVKPYEFEVIEWHEGEKEQ